jgi:lipoic acid synthetase
MGSICTRNCGFCDVETGNPGPLDASEPERIARAIRDLNIKYAVITSVTRDDLPDSGAGHFANIIKAVKSMNCKTNVEVLTPDFQKGMTDGIKIVLAAAPEVFGHNIEVTKRFHKLVKKLPSDYDRSLSFLQTVKDIMSKMITKTGMMVGVGENETDVCETIDDLAQAQVDILTIGQYLPPSDAHHKLDRYVSLEEFDRYREYGERKGIKVVESGPLIRSSYKAAKVFEKIIGEKDYIK